MRRWPVLVPLVLAACTASAEADSRADRSAAEHARIAGDVMTRASPDVRTSFLAARVVGRGSDDVITALVAEGTGYSGRVILKITIQGAGTLENPSDTDHCFEYRFRHTLDDARARPLDSCPDLPALTLPDPASYPTVTDETRRRVQAALSTLSGPDRAAPVAVRTALAAALGADFTVVAARDDGAVGVRVSAAGTCLDAVVLASGSRVGSPKRGSACTGG